MKIELRTEHEMLALCKLPAYQQLNAYYGQESLFSILGIERNENRHSAFLAWLLNPDASHALKEVPMRQFLALAAANADTEDRCYWDSIRQHLIAGNYQLEVEAIQTEKSIISFAEDREEEFADVVEKSERGSFKTDSQNRFDIWMLVNITFGDDQRQETWTLPIVIENKIYSKEGNAKDKEHAQTVRYHRAIEIIKNIVCDNNHCQPLKVYLSPDNTNAPTSEAFIPMTYQQMLDHVILPASILSATKSGTSETQLLIDGYIRNLSMPASDENMKEYSILGIAETENSMLESIYQTPAFTSALCTLYEKESRLLLGDDFHKVEEDLPLIEQFWNANENIFKMALYNHFKNDKDKMKIVHSIIKVNNRDNTRYLVATREGAEWLNQNGKAASKSEAAQLIAKAFCWLWKEKKHTGELNVDKLRDAFPGSLNTYYHDRFLQHLFYDFKDDLPTIDVSSSKYYGNAISENNDWDFYWDDAHQLPNVEGDVRMVKMWRKADFDRLVSHAKKEFGIVVVPKE